MSHFVSKETFKKMTEELKNLKSQRREVAERLKKSAAYGDLSENSEYQQAREEKEMLERRIFDLGQKIRETEVKEKKDFDGEVSIYSKIMVKNRGDIFFITLVPPEEIDLLQKRISINSPLGEGFLGRKKGDTIKIKTPTGREEYLILDVK
ncbi:MAG: GreA/GreB family elongation factor [Patescibacteria group bacterium]